MIFCELSIEDWTLRINLCGWIILFRVLSRNLLPARVFTRIVPDARYFSPSSGKRSNFPNEITVCLISSDMGKSSGVPRRLSGGFSSTEEVRFRSVLFPTRRSSPAAILAHVSDCAFGLIRVNIFASITCLAAFRKLSVSLVILIFLEDRLAVLGKFRLASMAPDWWANNALKSVNVSKKTNEFVCAELSTCESAIKLSSWSN